MPYRRPRVGLTKNERLTNRQYEAERKEQRAAARQAAKADRIARGIKGPEIEWPQPPIPAGVANSIGAAR
jgi:hypothetical protein